MVVDRLAAGGAHWLWAKSGLDERHLLSHWLPLHQHMIDSAEVAGLLWDRWLAPRARALVAQRSGGEVAGRAVAVLLAGAHDIGKATPVFQRRVRPLAQQIEPYGLRFDPTLVDEDAHLLPHGLAGHVLLARYLRERGFDRAAADQWAAVVGGHHGIPPEPGELQPAEHRPVLVGTGAWADVQRQLLDAAVQRSGIDLVALAGRALGLPAAAVLSGLVIVADWLASNDTLFPLVPLGHQPVPDGERTAAAWRRVGLPRPWEAVDTGADADALLRMRFELPAGAVARPVQVQALQVARTCDLPGIVVVEAPMGEGKSEAALLAAEVLAARSGASGVFVALPTQATTNAMFARVLQWLSHVPDGGVARESSDLRHSVTLAHGKAGLDPVFRSLRAPGRPGGVDVDGLSSSRHGRDRGTVEAYLHWWMTNKKKSPLAEFVVGTIDQLLFVALQARHLVLRHLGMVGKVVIIDEVHSYDAYMNVYLERTLEWLGAYGVPVVLLSATLPPATRAVLVEAHRRGTRTLEDSNRTWTVPQWSTSLEPSTEPAPAGSPGEPPYPVVTTVRGGELVTEPMPASVRGSRVRIELCDDHLDALAVLLTGALADGGCALVVRNPVASARATYDRLVGVFGAEHLTLTHSRFLAVDRARNDARLREDFGPDGERRTHRIVVATQVVEQSLDVDFDLLVTDLAPIDLVLQRVGRLHRHERGRPARLAVARCIVLTPQWGEVPVDLDHGSRAVYAPYLLWRSAALLQRLVEDGGWLRLPQDIAPLVRSVYGGGDVCPPAWSEQVEQARLDLDKKRATQRSKAEAFRLRPPHEGRVSLTGWLGRSLGEADESTEGLAQVRDTEDSIEVLVLLNNGAGGARLPGWIGEHHGEPVPDSGEIDVDLARAIASCAVRLPSSLTRGSRGEAMLDAIEDAWHSEAFQRVPELRGQLVLRMTPDAGCGASVQLAGTHFTYHPDTGLRTEAAVPGGSP